jgi:hypothetical protein
LHAPNRVAIDLIDTTKLQIDGEPMGARLEMGGQSVWVSALTEGVRSFTLVPNVFAEVETARRLARLAEGQANYWVADLHNPSCAADVIATIEANEPDVTAMTQPGFMKKTQDYWVFGSGRGLGARLQRAARARGGDGDRGADALRDHEGAFARARDVKGDRRDERGARSFRGVAGGVSGRGGRRGGARDRDGGEGGGDGGGAPCGAVAAGARGGGDGDRGDVRDREHRERAEVLSLEAAEVFK